MAEPDRHIQIDPELNSYQGYMPDEWAKATLGPIKQGTVLERLLLDLALAWRTAAYTAQMPATAVRATHAAAVGRGTYASPDSSVVSLTDKIIAELSQKVPEFFENGSLRARVTEALATITDEFRERTTKVREDFPIEPMWKDFLQEIAFKLSLWSSQRVTFVAFYNAYEVFLVDCLKVATGATSLRTPMEEFRVGLRTAFRRNVADPCWFHREINLARLVRHALIHNGGRLTEDLKKQQHEIVLIDDELQIQPKDNLQMLRRLRAAVDKVVEVTKDEAKFTAPAAKLVPPSESDD
jgi:hypothetical protein